MRGYIFRLVIMTILASALDEILRISTKSYKVIAGSTQNSIQNEETRCVANFLNSTLTSLLVGGTAHKVS